MSSQQDSPALQACSALAVHAPPGQNNSERRSELQVVPLSQAQQQCSTPGHDCGPAGLSTSMRLPGETTCDTEALQGMIFRE